MGSIALELQEIKEIFCFWCKNEECQSGQNKDWKKKLIFNLSKLLPEVFQQCVTFGFIKHYCPKQEDVCWRLCLVWAGRRRVSQNFKMQIHLVL